MPTVADIIEFLGSDYAIHLYIIICLYLILAQSLNLNFGLGWMLNLAHVSVYAIGAYTTALLSTELEYSIWICLPVSMILSGFLAFLIGGISLKLSEEYFALGTLAFASVVSALLINWKSVTRGVLGIPGIPRPEIFGYSIDSNRGFLVLAATVTILLLVWLYFVFQSRLARQLRAQAESIPAAQSLALNIKGIKNDSIIVASICAGAAGSLFSYYINYIDPSSFGLHEMVFLLSIVVIGKPGSFWGCIFATIFLVLLPEPLREVEIRPDLLGPMRQLLYAVILFAVIYWKRETLFPVQRSV